MRADKQKVTDEVWDDDRVKSFLISPDPAGAASQPDAADFTLLLQGYQHMRPGDFKRFVGFFADHGHDLDATNEHGETFVDYVSRYRHAGDFIAIMTQAGARPAVAA